jgi:hypothetical protein
MSSPHARHQQQRRRNRERQRPTDRREPPADSMAARPPGAHVPMPTERRRAAATTCGWCSGPITPRSRGPVATWCSPSCRQRAWEQRRAAASGLSAVEVVERVVEIPAPPVPPRHPRHGEWRGLLRELTHQLDDNLVYDRHLAGIALEVHQVSAALARRRTWG